MIIVGFGIAILVVLIPILAALIHAQRRYNRFVKETMQHNGVSKKEAQKMNSRSKRKLSYYIDNYDGWVLAFSVIAVVFLFISVFSGIVVGVGLQGINKNAERIELLTEHQIELENILSDMDKTGVNDNIVYWTTAQTIIDNKIEINKLQLQSVDASIYRWWLYFGK